MKIKIKKLDSDAKTPSYAHPGDAGLDIFSNENSILKPNHRKAISTGISVELPKGYVGLVWDKSGIAIKSGIKTMAGVMDASYRGEYHIVLVNLSSKNYEIKKGEKIAQLLIQKVENAQIEIVEELSSSKRGKKGFGSTGLI
jgi:dUTP pyrophosphatase